MYVQVNNSVTRTFMGFTSWIYTVFFLNKVWLTKTLLDFFFHQKSFLLKNLLSVLRHICIRVLKFSFNQWLDNKRYNT